jgi:hypothetical protein
VIHESRYFASDSFLTLQLRGLIYHLLNGEEQRHRDANLASAITAKHIALRP